MRVVFHIGMGKTGTTAIQGALAAGQDRLAAQGVHYLGMWFETVAPRFKGYEGLAAFVNEPPARQRAHAAALADALEALAADGGPQLFVHSNEGLFGPGRRLAPFFGALAERVDVSFLAYLRPVRSWLPSAFAHWGISHKVNEGGIRDFGTTARELIGQYGAVRRWKREFGDRLELRLFNRDIDVVDDFARAVGISLNGVGARRLERPEPVETVLRALFNDRFDAPVLPRQFDMSVMPRRRTPRSVARMAEICLDHSEIDEIVAENAGIFEYIRSEGGPDLEGPAERARPSLGSDELRDRMMDFLVEIVLQQSIRLRALERARSNVEE